MTPLKLGAIVLILVGVLALALGSFTYTRESHEASLGPIELTVTEKETINLPIWSGLAAIVIGGGLLFLDGRKS